MRGVKANVVDLNYSTGIWVTPKYMILKVNVGCDILMSEIQIVVGIRITRMR